MESKLDTYIKSKGITQAEFADKLGITQSAMSKLCNGGSTSLETAMKIEAATEGEVCVEDLKPFDQLRNRPFPNCGEDEQ